MTRARALHALARAVGLAREWVDASGARRTVSDDTLRAAIAALGYEAADERAARAALQAWRMARNRAWPPVLVGASDARIELPTAMLPASTAFQVTGDDGSRVEGVLECDGHRRRVPLPALLAPGWHTLELAGRTTRLAVAPAHAPSLAQLGARRAAWGIGVQRYALRRRGDGGLGDDAALLAIARAAAAHGADVVMTSPAHAGFAARPECFGPYAPSSRRYRNWLYADPGLAVGIEQALPESDGAALIDWPRATRLRRERMRALHARLSDSTLAGDFELWRNAAGPALELHARFEAIAEAERAQGRSADWRQWPAALRDARSAEVERFAREHAQAVNFHAFAQWISARSAQAVQRGAVGAGLAIGILDDLAVGSDPAGSDAWSSPATMLRGLTIGAPPDALAPHGQGWGLTVPAPAALVEHGYAPFLDILRANLGLAGGLRIDHVLGLRRLWVIPDGASSDEGVYLAQPFEALLHLLALEAHRANALIVAEDLGTVPEGFRERIARAGLYGMRLLPFERDADGPLPPPLWTGVAVAMTTTHDLAPIAGWWRGEDLTLRERLSLVTDPGAARVERARERDALARAFRASGATTQPLSDDAEPGAVTAAAAAHVGASACELVLLPTEDLSAALDAPNVPGTIDEAPNWRRRDRLEASAFFDDPTVATTVAALRAARDRAPG